MAEKINALQDADINGAELLNLLRNGWKAIAVGLALGVAAAGTGIVLLPKKYEAVALIRVGQIAQVNGSGSYTVVSQPIEPPAQAMERMGTAQFQRRVAEALGDQAWLQDIERSSLAKAYSLELVKNGQEPNQVPLIELRVPGHNTDAALKKLEAVAEELGRTHSEPAEAVAGQLRANLDLARVRLAETERTLAEVAKALQATDTKANRLTSEMILPFFRLEKESQIFVQRQMIMALEVALRAPATRPTQLIEAAYVPAKPVFPKPVFLLAVGVICGLLGGVLWIFWCDRWRWSRQSKEHL